MYRELRHEASAPLPLLPSMVSTVTDDTASPARQPVFAHITSALDICKIISDPERLKR